MKGQDVKAKLAKVRLPKTDDLMFWKKGSGNNN